MTRIEASAEWHARNPNADQATITFTNADLAIYAELIAFARKRAGIGASSGVTSLACIFDDDEDCAVEGCGCACHGVICYVRGSA